MDSLGIGGSCLFTDDGEPVRIIELIPASEASPLQTLLDQETAAQTARLAAEFDLYLGKARRLKKLFALLYSGVSKPRALARTLKIRIKAVASLRKRLERRLADFYAAKTSAEIRV